MSPTWLVVSSGRRMPGRSVGDEGRDDDRRRERLHAREDAGRRRQSCRRRRAGTPWEGDWAQGLHWLSRELRRDTWLIPRMDLTWRGLVPPAVLEGSEPDRTLSGTLRRVGRASGRHDRPAGGGCIASTIPLADADPADPLVRTILSRLLELASP